MSDADRLSLIYGISVQAAQRLLDLAGGEIETAEEVLRLAAVEGMLEQAEGIMQVILGEGEKANQ